MAEHPGTPLSTLLSQALVAFTIEFDNEAERRIAHWTTERPGAAGERRGLWLTSMVMWLNCMRYVPDDGVTVAELARLARTSTNIRGMRRWGYLRVEPAAGPGSRVRPDDRLRPTRRGRAAQDAWRPLGAEIEDRWRARFGHPPIEALRGALWPLVRALPADLPDCMPILGYGLASPRPARRVGAADDGWPEDQATLGLAELLARVLVAFTDDFEDGSALSLALTANVLRVLDTDGAATHQLPQRTGVSKESIAMALGFLENRKLAVTGTGTPGGRFRVVRLTSRGAEEAARHLDRRHAVEEAWRTRFGPEAVAGLHHALVPLVGGGTPATSPLFAGLEPDPDGWRAGRPRPETLPHHPMVLHRGGFPDGA